MTTPSKEEIETMLKALEDLKERMKHDPELRKRAKAFEDYRPTIEQAKAEERAKAAASVDAQKSKP